MKKVTTIVILCLSVLSCQNSTHQVGPIGKWAGINENEYFEMHIDSKQIHIYSMWQANMGSIQYVFKQDSIRYYELGYSIGFKRLSDSIIVLSSTESNDTLFMLPTSIDTFDEVDRNDSIALKAYYDSYYERAYALLEAHGIIFEDVEEDSIDDEYDFDMEMIVE
jgi:hypothetical protein